MSNVYDQAADLYAEPLMYQRARLQHLPTDRSRKWRNSSLSVPELSEVNIKHSEAMMASNRWFAIRWVQA